ncbi:hypothetical protein [Streptomyces sioyaensis]|uniref:hypothetical protein n=1 Tax=Streptomyces sioyaensis TaxID=67364 RepID=UPI0036E175BD
MFSNKKQQQAVRAEGLRRAVRDLRRAHGGVGADDLIRRARDAYGVDLTWEEAWEALRDGWHNRRK